MNWNKSALCKPVSQQHGAFGGFTVYGILLKSDSPPARFWEITLEITLEDGRVDHTYWVDHKEFRLPPPGGLGGGVVFCDGAITNPPEAENRAALQAIKSWEGKAASS